MRTRIKEFLTRSATVPIICCAVYLFIVDTVQVSGSEASGTLRLNDTPILSPLALILTFGLKRCLEKLADVDSYNERERNSAYRIASSQPQDICTICRY